jgi:predicted phage terminase large subunit-like protein
MALALARRPIINPDALRAVCAQKWPKLSPRKAMLAQLAEQSFHEFVKQAWPNIESAEFVDGPHIKLVCEHLQAITNGQIRWLLINIPPRHCKSSLVNVLWPAWEWGPRNRPGESYLSVSHRSDLSDRDLHRCRLLLDSPWYQERWGNRFGWLKDQCTLTRYRNDKKGCRISTAKGAALGEGGTRLLFDDLQNAVSVRSQLQRETDWQWYRDTFMLRDSSPLKSVRICIGQRLHEDDIYGRMLAHEKRWVHLRLPMSYEPWDKCVTTVGEDWRTYENEPIWPQQFEGDVAMAIEFAKAWELEEPYVFSSQGQQHPTPPGGLIFCDDQFMRYDHLPQDQGMPYIFSSWDLATEGLELGCACAGVLMAYYPQSKSYYILDERHFRKEFPQQVIAIQELADAFPEAQAHVVEKQSNGAAAIATLQGMVKGIQPFPTAGLGSKEQKWRAVSPRVRGGNVFVPNESWAPWIKLWLKEVCGAPFATQNDRTDAFSNGILWMELINLSQSRAGGKILCGTPQVFEHGLINLSTLRQPLMSIH